MKYLIGLVLLGGAATGLYFFINKKIALGTQANIVINSTSVEPGLLTTKLIFDVDIINPSNADEIINSFTADVIFNNTPFGKINYLKPITITPQGKTNIKVELDESNIDLLKNFPALIESSFSGIKIILDGFLNTSLGQVPFQKVTQVI